MYVTSYMAKLFFGKPQQLHELGLFFLTSGLSLPVVLRQSLATKL